MNAQAKLTHVETEIANAFLDAKEMLLRMMQEGIDDPKYYFAAAKLISEKYNFSQEQSIIILEKALKLI